MKNLGRIIFILLIGLFLYLNYNIFFKDTKPVNIDKTFVIKSDPYDLDVNIIITLDTAKALAFIKKNTDSTITIEDFRDNQAVTFMGYGTPTIWFSTLSKSPNDLSKASHELMHVLYYITNRAGLQLNEETDEAFAYEMDYLTLQLFKQIR